MSVQTAPAPPARPGWSITTPDRLRTALAGLWLLCLAFYAAVAFGVREHRAAVQTVGKDAAPSIVAAQKIKASLADMHANAANVLLHPPGRPGQAATAYESRRVEVTEGVLAAAGNVTYGEAERGPLRQMLNDLGRYEALIAQATVLHEKNDPAFMDRHRTADAIVSKSLLPAADALDKVNRDALDRGYKGMRRLEVLALLGVLAGGVALVAALLATQVFLCRRTHRVFSPGLLAATALTVGFFAWTVAELIGQQRSLRIAKEDAFESIHDLWLARAEAYDANGDESRWLLEVARKGGQPETHEKAFNDKADRILKAPGGKTVEVARGLERTLRSGARPPGKAVKGHLGKAAANVTFPGEREKLADALAALGRYLQIDADIRRLARQGKQAEALALCLGTQPGQSNWAFERFDSALEATIDVNQKHFDEAVEKSFKGLAPFDFAAPLAALAVAALAFLGLRPRLREYAIT